MSDMEPHHQAMRESRMLLLLERTHALPDAAMRAVSTLLALTSEDPRGVAWQERALGACETLVDTWLEEQCG